MQNGVHSSMCNREEKEFAKCQEQFNIFDKQNCKRVFE